MAFGGALTLAVSERRKHPAVPRLLHNLARLRASNAPIDSECGVYYNSPDAPLWLQPLFSDPSLRRVFMREWEDAEWRKKSGWQGTDLIHNPEGSGVQVLAYFWNAESLTLTGIVRFGPGAESHRGLCHGGASEQPTSSEPATTSESAKGDRRHPGSAPALGPPLFHRRVPPAAVTSLMDDLCGHICFFAGPAPWCCATVQVNCKLMKPVRVGDVHKVVGKIYKQEAKEKNGKTSTKVFISAELLGEDGALYASLEGLSITPVRYRRYTSRFSRVYCVTSIRGLDELSTTTVRTPAQLALLSVRHTHDKRMLAYVRSLPDSTTRRPLCLTCSAWLPSQLLSSGTDGHNRRRRGASRVARGGGRDARLWLEPRLALRTSTSAAMLG